MTHESHRFMTYFIEEIEVENNVILGFNAKSSRTLLRVTLTTPRIMAHRRTSSKSNKFLGYAEKTGEIKKAVFSALNQAAIQLLMLNMQGFDGRKYASPTPIDRVLKETTGQFQYQTLRHGVIKGE